MTGCRGACVHAGKFRLPGAGRFFKVPPMIRAMDFCRFTAVGVAVLAMAMLAACMSVGSGPSGFGRPVVAGADAAKSAPGSFLQTDFAPLREWLDEDYDVTYLNMRLGGTEKENVFAQRPIEDVHFRFEDVGRSGSLFQLKAKDISRREILYRIAKHYGLRMTVENVNGKPAHIKVQGNERGSRFDPGQTVPDEGGVREF